jgi:hypothetical protein
VSPSNDSIDTHLTDNKNDRQNASNNGQQRQTSVRPSLLSSQRVSPSNDSIDTHLTDNENDRQNASNNGQQRQTSVRPSLLSSQRVSPSNNSIDTHLNDNKISSPTSADLFKANRQDVSDIYHYKNV